MEYDKSPGPPGPPPSAPPPYTANYGPAPTTVCKLIIRNTILLKLKFVFKFMIFGFKTLLLALLLAKYFQNFKVRKILWFIYLSFEDQYFLDKSYL